LRVLASNSHAIRFYEKLGFYETSRQPLKLLKRDSGNELVETEGPEADDAWISMKAELKNFQTTDDYVLTAGPLRYKIVDGYWVLM
jgi:hypothetical protein